MADKALPSPELLRQLLRYEPETGNLFWLPRQTEMFSPGNTSSQANCAAWNSKYAHREAFKRRDRYGYLWGYLFKGAYRAHRVAWAIFNGAWPEQNIDHVNLDKSDNRIANLRTATASDNMRNRVAPATNSSGYKGVHLHKQSGRWRARIRSGGENHIHLGMFDTKEAAHAAYCQAAEKYHQDFARTE